MQLSSWGHFLALKGTGFQTLFGLLSDDVGPDESGTYHSVICESAPMTTTTTTTTTTVATTTMTIPEGWEKIEDGFIVQVVYDSLTYFGAAQRCKELGGRLFEPKDKARQSTISNYLAALGVWYTWIGVHDAYQENKYVNADICLVVQHYSDS